MPPDTAATLAPAPAKIRLRRSLAQALAACSTYEPGRTEEAEFGSAVHDAIARYILLCKARGEESAVDETDAIAHESFYVSPRGLDPAHLDDVRDLLDRWARSHVANLPTLIGVEHTFTGETEHFLFDGTADRVDLVEGTFDRPQGIRITDWKSSWASNPIEPHSFQTRFYGALACLTWPTLRYVETDVDYVRHMGAAIVEETYDREYLLAFLAEFDAGLHRILTGPRVAMGGRACQYCARRGDCSEALPPWSKVPSTREEAIDAVQQLYRMEEAVAMQKERVRQYFKGVAPMVVGGEEIGFLSPREPSLKVTKPLTAARALMQHNVNGIALLSMDGRGVPARFRQDLIDAGLAVEEYSAPTFKHRKAPEPVAAPATTEDTP